MIYKYKDKNITVKEHGSCNQCVGDTSNGHCTLHKYMKITHNINCIDSSATIFIPVTKEVLNDL
jgi:hypothetical protein